MQRDKLKSNAVPTEDGPFCIPAESQAMLEEDDKPAIPINADDIENEKLNSVEKKSHSSVKYGDFLISDVTELFNSSHNSIDSQTSHQLSYKRHAKNENQILNVGKFLDSKYNSQNNEDIHNYTIIYSNDEITNTKPTFPVSSVKATPNDTIVAREYEEHSILNEPLKTKGQLKQTDSANSSVYQSSSVKTINPDKKVKILSEQTISEPLFIDGKLHPISPSTILRRPTKKIQSDQVCLQTDWVVKPQPKIEENIDLQAFNNDVTPLQKTIWFEQTIPIDFEHRSPKTGDGQQNIQGNMNAEKQSQTENVDNEHQTTSNDDTQKQIEIPLEQEFLDIILERAGKLTEPEPELVKSKNIVSNTFTPTGNSVSKSILKSKITPEKLAAIEQKRKFNLKLRDVISSCLYNLDEQNDIKISPEKRQAVQRNLRLKAHSPISTQGSMVTYLEARLQRMEDTLLNKIDHNTQRINELKRTIKPSRNAKHANTQTYLNHMAEESQKQYLYKEISKFLSPNANIKIYEELFLGKTSQDNSETSTPRKLRKRR